MLYGRKVVRFIDDTVASSKSVHGYANEPGMAAVAPCVFSSLRLDRWTPEPVMLDG